MAAVVCSVVSFQQPGVDDISEAAEPEVSIAVDPASNSLVLLGSVFLRGPVQPPPVGPSPSPSITPTPVSTSRNLVPTPVSPPEFPYAFSFVPPGVGSTYVTRSELPADSAPQASPDVVVIDGMDRLRPGSQVEVTGARPEIKPPAEGFRKKGKGKKAE